MRRLRRFISLLALLTVVAVALGAAPARPAPLAAGPAFVVTFPAALHASAVTGRVYVALSRHAKPEPREEAGELATSVPFFGRDVVALAPGEAVTIDATTPGYPTSTPTLAAVPPGDYDAQAILSVYTRYHRADGHVIWAHQDRWEGQQFGLSPGNLVSRVVRVHVAPGARIALALSRVLPPVVVPPDTAWVKHVKIRSALLTRFWGVPQYLGATVLLPKGYAAQPGRRYPAVYAQTHFTLGAMFGFDPARKPPTPKQRAALARYGARESAYEWTHEWMRGDVPPMVGVVFQHPTPYYDDSYAVDSANNGPYGTAIMTELIPYLESHFRLIRSGTARFLIGGSTGGWEALALQIDHPDAFNGAWGLYPDPVDFHRFQLGDLYADANAFTEPYAEWNAAEIGAQRRADGLVVETMRGESRLEYVRGSHARSGEQFNAWDAAWGPVGADGYPRELWDKHTGRIDRAAVLWSRAHGYDLTEYLVRSWARIGPSLVGKLHVDVGDQDDYWLNLACYRMQHALARLTPSPRAVFHYGRPLAPHGWQARSSADYLREMAARVPNGVAAAANWTATAR
ncbi:MAG TPA: alpha/beta hydrolase-fold protein [Candidatus Baltobacteraceae bacterium]|nr:alpha/beta hydrolase-fold protein [Candidatus Baltobacteraceae bacterium]